MERERAIKLTITFTNILIGLLLTYITTIIPVANISNILLPMHLSVIVCGIICGFHYGVITGFTLPILAFFMLGEPTIYPTGLLLMLELVTYGGLANYLYQYTNGKVFYSLIGAMLGARITYGIASLIILYIETKSIMIMPFISNAFLISIPGIILQLISTPVIIY